MSAFLRQERVVFFFERVRKKKKNTSTHQLVLLLIFSLIIYSNQTRSTQTDRINSLDGNWRRSVFRLLRIIDIINITFFISWRKWTSGDLGFDPKWWKRRVSRTSAERQHNPTDVLFEKRRHFFLKRSAFFSRQSLNPNPFPTPKHALLLLRKSVSGTAIL